MGGLSLSDKALQLSSFARTNAPMRQDRPRARAASAQEPQPAKFRTYALWLLRWDNEPQAKAAARALLSSLRSQPYQVANPSPLRAETCRMVMPGLTCRALA